MDHTPESSLDPQYATVESLIDKLLASRVQLNRVTVEFLKIDVETGITFSIIAMHSDDPLERRRITGKARLAYDTVLRLMDRVALESEDARLLEKRLEHSRSRLFDLEQV